MTTGLQHNGLMEEPRLSPEDQAKVDEYVSTGLNAVERKPFRPFRLLLLLFIIVSGMSGLSLLIARLSGIE